MNITKNHDGALIIQDIVKGYLITRKYYFYTKKEAISRFKNEIKELKTV